MLIFCDLWSTKSKFQESSNKIHGQVRESCTRKNTPVNCLKDMLVHARVRKLCFFLGFLRFMKRFKFFQLDFWTKNFWSYVFYCGFKTSEAMYFIVGLTNFNFRWEVILRWEATGVSSSVLFQPAGKKATQEEAVLCAQWFQGVTLTFSQSLRSSSRTGLSGKQLGALHYFVPIL